MNQNQFLTQTLKPLILIPNVATEQFAEKIPSIAIPSEARNPSLD